jgi:hypothetical protein
MIRPTRLAQECQGSFLVRRERNSRHRSTARTTANVARERLIYAKCEKPAEFDFNLQIAVPCQTLSGRVANSQGDYDRNLNDTQNV